MIQLGSKLVNTRSCAGAAGRSGRASDDLAAALDVALVLEDADNDGSSTVIDSGGPSERRTPVGVGESSSLGLPPRPARAGRALSGRGGGGEVDRGSSANPSLGPRGNSSPNPSFGGDDADDDQEMSEVSEGHSAAARGMASVGMRFHEGRGGATSPVPPPIPATSPLQNPRPCGETTKNQLCFLDQGRHQVAVVLGSGQRSKWDAILHGREAPWLDALWDQEAWLWTKSGGEFEIPSSRKLLLYPGGNHQRTTSSEEGTFSALGRHASSQAGHPEERSQDDERVDCYL